MLIIDTFRTSKVSKNSKSRVGCLNSIAKTIGVSADGDPGQMAEEFLELPNGSTKALKRIKI